MRNVLISLSIAIFFEFVLFFTFGARIDVMACTLIIFFGFWIVLDISDIKNTLKNEPKKKKTKLKKK